MKHFLRALRGLYAIADRRWLPTAVMVERVRPLLIAGVRVLQYRDKKGGGRSRIWHGRLLQDLCRRHGVLFVINDDLSLARYLAADGVHLGSHDLSSAVARRRLGKRLLIGSSCYNSLALARKAQQEGANYVAFGSFFPSRTKQNTVVADLSLLREARSEIALPVCAIGGIRSVNAALMFRNGADMVACSEAIFGNQAGVREGQKILRIFCRKGK